MKRAAEVAGVSVSTIRRNKELLREHGAVLDPDGWKVPMSALIASGLMRRTTPPDQPAPVHRGAEVPTEALMPERVRELERELLEERHRRELAEERQRAAEAVAHERGEALEDVRTAMRMLTAGPTTTTTTAPETAPEAAPGPPESERPAQRHAAPRRTWWNRFTGRGH
jgi:DNA-binding protein H-NS